MATENNTKVLWSNACVLGNKHHNTFFNGWIWLGIHFQFWFEIKTGNWSLVRQKGGHFHCISVWICHVVLIFMSSLVACSKLSLFFLIVNRCLIYICSFSFFHSCFGSYFQSLEVWSQNWELSIFRNCKIEHWQIRNKRIWKRETRRTRLIIMIWQCIGNFVFFRLWNKCIVFPHLVSQSHHQGLSETCFCKNNRRAKAFQTKTNSFWDASLLPEIIQTLMRRSWSGSFRLRVLDPSKSTPNSWSGAPWRCGGNRRPHNWR